MNAGNLKVGDLIEMKDGTFEKVMHVHKNKAFTLIGALPAVRVTIKQGSFTLKETTEVFIKKDSK